MVEERVGRLESQLHEVMRRVVELEARTAAAPSAATRTEAPSSSVRPAPGLPSPRPASPVPAPPAAVEPAYRASLPPAHPRRTGDFATTLEDLLGGRVLAWVGGAAVLFGIAFLFALAISRGWLGEAGRTLLGGGASGALLLIGAWLRDRKGRTDAALAAGAAGIAGLFVTLTVAAQVYYLVPAPLALAGGMIVGAIGASLAVRWDSRGIAALGIVGALLAPVLAGAPSTAATVALVFVAMASAVGVVVWRRWGWLSLLAFLVATPQWVEWVFSKAPLAGELAALGAFGALGFAGAVGHELRLRATRTRTLSAFLLALNAAVIAAAGWFALQDLDQEAVGKIFLAALALAHLLLALPSGARSRLSAELRLVALALGVVLADVTFALTVDGVLVTAGFAASAVGFAAFTRRVQGREHELAVRFGLGGHLALALMHTLVVDAPATLLTQGGVPSAGAAAAVVALASGCLISGRLADEGRAAWRGALDVAGLGTIAYLTALTMDGPWLVLAWALEACALARLARSQDDKLAGGAALCFLAGAGAYGLAAEVPLESLISGLNEPVSGLIALSAIALGCAVCARELASQDARLGPTLTVAALTVLLYLASCAIVTPFQPSGAAAGSTLLELDAPQQGQMALSVFWSVVGLAALVGGLLRDSRPLRVGGLSVLLLAVAKVFLFDLATLDSVYRVVSFVGLGVLLLVGAFVWQHVRPKPLPDLREAPEAAR